MEKYKFNVELELTKRELEILLNHTFGYDDEGGSIYKDDIIKTFANKPGIIKQEDGLILDALTADDFNEVLTFGIYAISKIKRLSLKDNQRTYGHDQIQKYKIDNISTELVDL